ncbi:MAG: hypothetical protein A3K18_35015 [Lentisphaerae bacterium RIFOXYA12_64_32]|nr:MAG: hypothetical protein A3K18_35015 [Lentisphaerae bacterium RIFOXYA12_64_32]
MSKNEPDLPELNALISEKLSAFPPGVMKLATKALQLSDQLPEQAVVEALMGHVREIARQQGGRQR